MTDDDYVKPGNARICFKDRGRNDPEIASFLPEHTVGREVRA